MTDLWQVRTTEGHLLGVREDRDNAVALAQRLSVSRCRKAWSGLEVSPVIIEQDEPEVADA